MKMTPEEQRKQHAVRATHVRKKNRIINLNTGETTKYSSNTQAKRASRKLQKLPYTVMRVEE